MILIVLREQPVKDLANVVGDLNIHRRTGQLPVDLHHPIFEAFKDRLQFRGGRNAIGQILLTSVLQIVPRAEFPNFRFSHLASFRPRSDHCLRDRDGRRERVRVLPCLRQRIDMRE